MGRGVGRNGHAQRVIGVLSLSQQLAPRALERTILAVLECHTDELPQFPIVHAHGFSAV